MRRRLLSIGCLFLLTAALQAQSYTPFLDNSQWFVNEEGAQVSAFDWYMTGKDTLIGGETFFQVIKDPLRLPIFVREDVAQRKVWMASKWDGYNPRILYDFSLQLGDTVQLRFKHQLDLRFVVTLIDGVNTTQGFKDRLTLGSIDGFLPDEIHWAVGIGDEEHPFYLDFIDVADPTYHLICNYQNMVKLFDDGFSSCPAGPPPLGIADDLSADELPVVFPLPARERLQVDLPGRKGTWVAALYDLRGRRLAVAEGRAGTRLVMPLQALPNGNYVLRFRSPDGRYGGRPLQVAD